MEKELITKRLCLTKDVGLHGNLFGGVMMSWLDESAALFAFEKCESPMMVTAGIDKTTFLKPVRPGHGIHIYGKIEKFTTTTIVLHLEATRIDFDNTNEELVCHTKVVFVRINESGRPCAIHSKAKKEWENNL